MQTDESGAPWPYERTEDRPREPPSKPTWECPEGICECGKHLDAPLREHSVLLCDSDGRRMPGARCRVLWGRRLLNGDMPYADGEGWVTVVVRGQPKALDIEWAPASLPREARFPHRREYYVELAKEDRGEWARRTLANLDFFRHASLSECIAAFQRHYRYTAVTGEVEDVEAELEAYHDLCMVPVDRPDRSVQVASPHDDMALGQRATSDAPSGAVTPVAGAAAGPSPGGRPVPQVAPTAAPAPPPSRGYEKTGGGIAPGQGAVVAPRRRYRIELFRETDRDEVIWAPAHTLKRTRDDLWYLEIPRGCHTAVTFIGAGGVPITSNNRANAVTMDPGVWVEANTGTDRRTIFFHGWRRPKDPADPEDAGKDHTTLFEDGQAPAPLQVKVLNYPAMWECWVDMWLAGPSCALNALDPNRKEPAERERDYHIEYPVTLEYNHPIPPGMPAADIFKRILEAHAKAGPLVHLVLNAHAVPPCAQNPMVRSGRGRPPLTGGAANGVSTRFVNLGKEGLGLTNVWHWEKLSGKVKYIWFLNCHIGGQVEFMSKVRDVTGAWVSACPWVGLDRPGIGRHKTKERKMLAHHIDYRPDMLHWLPKADKQREPRAGSFEPDPDLQDEFFAGARHSPRPSLRTALYFNIVARTK